MSKSLRRLVLYIALKSLQRLGNRNLERACKGYIYCTAYLHPKSLERLYIERAAKAMLQTRLHKIICIYRSLQGLAALEKACYRLEPGIRLKGTCKSYKQNGEARKAA